MGIVDHPASSAVADADAVRTDLGSIAYAGLLRFPQQTLAAQRLIDAYDRSTSIADRIMLAGEMAWLVVLSDDPADAVPALRAAA